jgi:hypothetical protein
MLKCSAFILTQSALHTMVDTGQDCPREAVILNPDLLPTMANRAARSWRQGWPHATRKGLASTPGEDGTTLPKPAADRNQDQNTSSLRRS